jgi:hypothetical protein
MELIGEEKQHIHSCKAYIVKSNKGSRETRHTIKARCVCVWKIYVEWVYMVKADIRGENLVET